jgi:hypothetical protein
MAAVSREGMDGWERPAWQGGGSLGRGGRVGTFQGLFEKRESVAILTGVFAWMQCSLCYKQTTMDAIQYDGFRWKAVEPGVWVIEQKPTPKPQPKPKPKPSVAVKPGSKLAMPTMR